MQNHALIYDIRKCVYRSVGKKIVNERTETLQRNNAGYEKKNNTERFVVYLFDQKISNSKGQPSCYTRVVYVAGNARR